MLDSVLVYLGFAVIFIGGWSILWPLRFLRVRTRARGAIVAAIGLLVLIVALSLAAETKTVSTPVTKLDEWMTPWQFAEQHMIHVDAPPDAVAWGAVLSG